MSNINKSGGVISLLNRGVEVRCINDKVGKGIFALKNFKEGEEVLSDFPVVTCQLAWSKNNNYKVCEYCMRGLENALETVRRLTQIPTLELPHPECCETKKELHVTCDDCPANYCSKKCKQQAYEEYHIVLCFHSEKPPENIRILEDYWRSIHGPPESSNIMLLVKLLVKLHLDKDEELSERISEFCQSFFDEELKNALLNEEDISQASTLIKLVKNVVNFSNIQQWLTLHGFIKLYLFLGRNVQSIGHCPFDMYTINVNKLTIPIEEKKATLDLIYAYMKMMETIEIDVGVGLYPLQSYVNHSCVPNCSVVLPDYNQRLILVALRDIEMGEEIRTSYMDLADMKKPRHFRKKYLIDYYYFDCNCPLCLEQIEDEENGASKDEEECSTSEDEERSTSEREEERSTSEDEKCSTSEEECPT